MNLNNTLSYNGDNLISQQVRASLCACQLLKVLVQIQLYFIHKQIPSRLVCLLKIFPATPLCRLAVHRDTVGMRCITRSRVLVQYQIVQSKGYQQCQWMLANEILPVKWTTPITEVQCLKSNHKRRSPQRPTAPEMHHQYLQQLFHTHMPTSIHRWDMLLICLELLPDFLFTILISCLDHPTFLQGTWE